MTNRVMAGRFVVVAMSAMYHTANRGGPGRVVRKHRFAPAQRPLALRRGPAAARQRFGGPEPFEGLLAERVKHQSVIFRDHADGSVCSRSSWPVRLTRFRCGGRVVGRS